MENTCKEMISVIIPCYNSENMIEHVLYQILETFNKEEYLYEVILINDASKDHTWDVVRRLCDEHQQVTAINLSKNFGQHAAIMAGFNLAQGDIIAGIDDDGEYNAEDFPKLINKLQEGYDYVCGNYAKKKTSIFRNIGTLLNNCMATKLIGKPKDIDLSSLYVMQGYVVREIIKYDKPFPYIAGLLLRVTTNISNIELIKKERLEGTSGYNLRKLVHLWTNGFTAFSILPLRLASLLGLICSSIGFIYGITIIIRKMLIPEIAIGYSSTMAAIMFIGGILMLLFGIIGEYVGRIYMCLNNSPQFVMKEVRHGDEDNSNNA